jgi:hypothetical protein
MGQNSSLEGYNSYRIKKLTAFKQTVGSLQCLQEPDDRPHLQAVEKYRILAQ